MTVATNDATIAKITASTVPKSITNHRSERGPVADSSLAHRRGECSCNPKTRPLLINTMATRNWTNKRTTIIIYCGSIMYSAG